MKTIFCLIIIFYVNTQLYSQKHNIIPKPQAIKLDSGYFTISDTIDFITNNKELIFPTKGFLKEIEKLRNKNFKIIPNYYKKIQIDLIKTEKKDFYKISITKNKIHIEGDYGGIIYAFQSLKLLSKKEKEKIIFPICNIVDYPDFQWRGMHLDCSRHFFSGDEIKKFIDYLCLYKFNKFHWHLTDDQGWRIEIKKYPKLTEIGSIRKGTQIGHGGSNTKQVDTIEYKGFYSQEEIKQIVKYAKERNIEIIPEIEMPGHALAALASYPEYACNYKSYEVAYTWGVHDDVFCAKDSTLTFLKDILTEIIQLFPGKYIHIGGDECPKSRWESCANCQKIVERENLKNTSQLQTYFINQIGKFLKEKNKILVGWDEILEEGLDKNSVIMSWRGTEGGVDAAKNNYSAVMTPTSHCYFDYYQGNPSSEPLAIGGYTTLEKVYSYNPVPESLPDDKKKYILGSQANIWTEYINDFKQVEYMSFPRICALSEVIWNSSEKNFDEFKLRLVNHFKFLDMKNINYSKSSYNIEFNTSKSNNGVIVELFQNFKSKFLKYSFDNDTVLFDYKKPVEITKSCTFKAFAFDEENKITNKIEQKFYISKSTGCKLELLTKPHESYNAGGSLTLCDGIIGRVPWYGKEWLGFYGGDCIAVFDFEKPEKISDIKVYALLSEPSWIYLPKYVKIYKSDDNVNFTEIPTLNSAYIYKNDREFNLTIIPFEARYVKMVIENIGIIPKGKPGEGNKSWLFIDEIIIE